MYMCTHDDKYEKKKIHNQFYSCFTLTSHGNYAYLYMYVCACVCVYANDK